MAILSTNQRLINVGDSYSAGNGIDITNNIISVTGDNEPYSAGDNIDIQDHIISGKDWSNDIENASANAYNVTTAWVQDNYANSADMTYISAMVDTKLDTSAWSSVSGDLATESYVIMADNINYAQATAYVENQNYAKASALENLSNDFDSLSSNINSNSGVWDDVVNKLYISSYHELSAGANINITDYVVSSRDWTNEIAQASANAVNEASALIPTLTFHYLEI